MNIEKSIFKYLARTSPNASATIKGGKDFPSIFGTAEFYQLRRGVIVALDISGLPKTSTNVFGCHIHEGDSCENNFAESGGHYNPNSQPHPCHAGDMPPLFAFDGDAFNVFYTERFSVAEVVGRAVILHQSADDFTTQPSGNSGSKIACGIIQS